MKAIKRLLRGSQLWWGEYALDLDQVLQSDIGPLSFAIRRLRQEWRIYYDYNPLWDEAAGGEAAFLDVETVAARGRYVMGQTTEGCTLVPALADRPVVTRPEIPFYILPGQQLTLFVSTPLWVGIQAGGERVPLLEVPILLLSDTWFGPSTRQGDLCYAINTNARIDPDGLLRRSYRAITPVVVSNRADDPLLLERLKLPVPLLDLYAAKNDFLWTQAVQMIRHSDEGKDQLKIQDGPPIHCPGAKLVAPARQKPDRKTLGSTLSMFFG